MPADTNITAKNAAATIGSNHRSPGSIIGVGTRKLDRSEQFDASAKACSTAQAVLRADALSPLCCRIRLTSARITATALDFAAP